MPARKNPRTKKERDPCRDCGKSMDGEHFAAKSCYGCRHPEEVTVKAIAQEPLGEAIGPTPEEAKRAQAEVVLPPSQVPPPSSPGPSVTPFFLRGGDTVSLNLKQRKFLILPKSKWELNPRKWSDDIPEGLDPVEMRMLRICLEAGDLIKGKIFTGIAKDDTTLTKAATLLTESEIVMRANLGKLVQHKGYVGGYIPYEIFRYLMRYEDDNEHRKRVLNFLQNALDHLGSGPPRTTPVVNKTIEQITDMKF